MSYWRSIPQTLLEHPPEWREVTAVATANASLSFAALREGVLRCASWLAEAGIGPGDRVAVCLPKGLVAAQAIYGILAAGAAYVPLPEDGPLARLRATLVSVQPKLLLTTAETAARLAAGVGDPTLSEMRVVALDVRDGAIAQHVASAVVATPPLSVPPESLAAIYFTSGSTGEPKGVMLSHRNLAAIADWMARIHEHRPGDRLVALSALHYVAAIELFYPAMSGCRIFLPGDRETMFPDRVAQIMEWENVTHVTMAATALRLLFEGGDLARRRLDDLRHVTFFGEPLPATLLDSIMAALPRARFLNSYGATEAYNMLSYYPSRPLPAGPLSIGRPMPYYDVSLRDDDGREVAPGEIGEICAAGPLVMSGYWNAPELTASRRFDGRADSYRTGDLARVGEDGLWHLVGRRDGLVKLRGHRFDLGEIEAVLRLHPSVREAFAFAVPPFGSTSVEIQAVIQVEGDGLLEAALRRLCAERLPRYARPGRILALARLPLLASGKVDRQALLAMLSRD